MASATFYPDTNAAGVDGYVQHAENSVTWTTEVQGVGTDAYDEYTGVQISANGTEPKWDKCIRAILVIDCSDLPPCTVTAVTLSIYGYVKLDDLSCDIDINVYSSAPASDTELVAGDFDSLGTAVYCDTPLTYAGWNTGTPGTSNDFIFNATGIAAVQAAADGNTVVKLGLRNANYDVAEELDPGNHSPPWVNNKNSYLFGFSTEHGTGYKPKLVVTYTVGAFVGSRGVIIG